MVPGLDLLPIGYSHPDPIHVDTKFSCQIIAISVITSLHEHKLRRRLDDTIRVID
jgi:hypothetical protein